MNNITEIVLKTPEGEQVFLLGEKLYTDTNSIEIFVDGKTSDGRDRKNITTGIRSLTIGQLNRNGGWQTIIGGENNTVPTVEDNPCGDLFLTGTGNFLVGTGTIGGGIENIGFGKNSLLLGEKNKDWVDEAVYEQYLKDGNAKFVTPSSASGLFGRDNINKGFAALLLGYNLNNKGNNAALIGHDINYLADADASYRDIRFANALLVGEQLEATGKQIFLFGERVTSSFSKTFVFGQMCAPTAQLQCLIGYNIVPSIDAYFSVGYNNPGKPGHLEVLKTGKVVVNAQPERGSNQVLRPIDLETYIYPTELYNVKIQQNPTQNTHPIRMVDITTKTFNAQFKSLRIQDAPATYESPIRKGDITVDNSRYQNFDVGFNSVTLKGIPTDNKHAVPKEYVDNAIKNIPAVEVDKTLTKEGAAADAKTVGDKLESKLEKVTGQTQYEQVYAKTPSGKPHMRTVSYTPQGGQIPIFGGMSTTGKTAPPQATIPVPMPEQPYQAVPKKYVDDLVASLKKYKHNISFRFNDPDTVLDGCSGMLALYASTDELLETYEKLKPYLLGEEIWVSDHQQYWEVVEVNDNNFKVSDNGRGTSDGTVTIQTVTIFDINDIVSD